MRPTADGRSSWLTTKHTASRRNKLPVHSANALLDIEKQSSQENSSKPKEPRAYTETEAQLHAAADPVVQYMTKDQLQKSIEQTRKLMQEAAKKLDFIEAAQYRDELLKLEELLKEKS